MRKLLLSTALAAGAGLVMLTSAPTPAAAANGAIPRICYEQPEFFMVFCQNFAGWYEAKSYGGHPAPTPNGYVCPSKW